MLTLHISLDPIRRSLFIALGLLAACGGEGGQTTSSSASGDTGGSTGSSSASTGEAVTSSTGAPTGGMSGTGTGETGAGESTTGEPGTTAGTSGVSASEATTTAATTGGATGEPGTTTTQGETGETGETGDDCVELMQAGTDPPVPSGWVKCGNKLPHRVDQVACEVNETANPCQTMDPGNQCNSDMDCNEKPFGSCHQFSEGLLFCGCVYGCETDADCAAGEVCRCGGDVLGPFTTCTPSACTDDDSCEGGLCQFAQTYGEDCPDEVNDGHCTTPDDQCDSDFMCGTTGCLFVDGVFQCSQAICGRPFFVDEVAVTAAASERDDWRGAALCAAVPAELAARLAAHWTEIGLFEHASVASFARFVLQLLAVGAPADLVSAASAALADEVEHARVCFALAATHGGAGVGPGPLPQARDGGALGLAAITEAVIREACVGETLSALEVRESAMRAEDVALRRLLGKIADDEQRHAELGWRFVRWALGRLDAAEQARMHEVFAAAIAGAEADAERWLAAPGTPELRTFGVVDAPLRGAIWRAGLTRLVRPSAAALHELRIAC
ncbi:MAG: ferritin-like domain-containing protein [Myxococcales bacterium]|nr:ferritin-like domain-containing protein [Myxococcales bacterium]